MRRGRGHAPFSRTASQSWLDQLLTSLPGLAWSQPVIDTLLQLLNTLADACDAGYGDEVCQDCDNAHGARVGRWALLPLNNMFGVAYCC